MDGDWVTDYAILLLTWPTSENWDSEMREEFKKRVLAYVEKQIKEGYPILDITPLDDFFTDWHI